MFPSSVTGSVVRGEPKYFDINIKNSGTAIAKNIDFLLPGNSHFSIIAAGDSNLEPGANTTLTLGYFQAETANIGTYRGSIVIK